MNFRFSSVPAPVKFVAWNAETIKCPGLFVFGVINIPLLSVPAGSNAGVAGDKIAGLKVICKSYEIII